MAMVVTETFLKLVNAHYWRRLESGELRPGNDGTQLLFTSLQMSQGGRCDLVDFAFIAKSMQKVARGKEAMLNKPTGPLGTPSAMSMDKMSAPWVQQGLSLAGLLESNAFNLVMSAVIVFNDIFIAAEMKYRTAEEVVVSAQRQSAT
mmetsp:Transcript_112659/g.363850  ORF Transcript_112659/g.363850 Transcript_112659/m.363850 type:complete len:147 (+) Transcript_112659:1381-1821(+)